MKFFSINSYLWHLEVPYRTDFYESEPANQGDPPNCGTCGKHITAMLVWLPPYRAELETWGRGFGDFVKGVGNDFLISERLKRLIDEDRITGFAGFEPVEIARVRRHARFRDDPPPYYHVTIERDSAAVDDVLSGCERGSGPVCPDCRSGGPLLRHRRVIIEKSTWGGNDIFVPRGVRATLVTERFKNLWEQSELRGLRFVPCESEEAGYDGTPGENFKRMREIMDMPLSEKLLEKQFPSGDVVRYYVPLNELVRRTTSGELSMFRPLEDLEYWNRLNK